MIERPAASHKASSRTSTGRTNREDKIKILLNASCSRANTGAKRCEGGDVRFHREQVPAELRERIGQSLKDDFDKFKLVHKLYDKIYRQTKNTRETFRTFDPEGIVHIFPMNLVEIFLL